MAFALASAAPESPPWPPAVLDLEASGFGRDSYPIEVGLVLADGRAWCSLIKPEADWLHWDDSAQAMHRISRDAALQHGRSAREVARTLNDWLRGQVVYSDAWAHDYTWLAQLYEAADLVPSFRLENLRALLSDEEAARWHTVKQQVQNEEQLVRHRASTDARVLQLTLKRLREPVGV